MLRYLAACVLAGAVVGRGFGKFARGSFHYPARRSDVSAAHGALLDALEVIEWPGLFALTLLVALLLWRWLRPDSPAPAPRASEAWRVATFAVLLGASLLVILPPTRPAGRPLSAVSATVLAALTAWLVGRLVAEARAASGSFRSRFAAQLPVPTGHLAATAAASLWLGYRGESALVHGIGVLVGVGLFVAEVASCLLVAALVGARCGRRRPTTA